MINMQVFKICKPRLHVSQYLYKFQHTTLNDHIVPLTYLVYKEFMLTIYPYLRFFGTTHARTNSGTTAHKLHTCCCRKRKKNISTRIRTCAVRLQRITRPWPQPLGQADTYMQVWNVRSVSIYRVTLAVPLVWLWVQISSCPNIFSAFFKLYRSCLNCISFIFTLQCLFKTIYSVLLKIGLCFWLAEPAKLGGARRLCLFLGVLGVEVSRLVPLGDLPPDLTHGLPYGRLGLLVLKDVRQLQGLFKTHHGRRVALGLDLGLRDEHQSVKLPHVIFSRALLDLSYVLIFAWTNCKKINLNI